MSSVVVTFPWTFDEVLSRRVREVRGRALAESRDVCQWNAAQITSAHFLPGRKRSVAADVAGPVCRPELCVNAQQVSLV